MLLRRNRCFGVTGVYGCLSIFLCALNSVQSLFAGNLWNQSGMRATLLLHFRQDLDAWVVFFFTVLCFLAIALNMVVGVVCYYTFVMFN